MLSKINETYCDKEGRPFQDIRIYHTVILDDPFPDPDGMYMRLSENHNSLHRLPHNLLYSRRYELHNTASNTGLAEPERSPSPPKEVMDSNRIGAEEDIDDFKVC